jgi:hypothetical protein
MEGLATVLIDDLRRLISELGKNGGIISPSIYDTAQALRLYPPPEGVEAGLDWLLAQQQPDGGWGNLAVARAREIPTLSAILALHLYATNQTMNNAIEGGLDFLRSQYSLWQSPLPEDIPTAAELLIPWLVIQARARGINVSADAYQSLRPLGDKKLNQIARLQPGAGTPPAFSWEVWGQEPSRRVVDELGSIGHNPTATIYWLRAAEQAPELQSDVNAAKAYLRKAAAATHVDIPGLYPIVWPLNRFEQSFSLYALIIADLLHNPSLQDVVAPQIVDIEKGISATGMGVSDYFIPDGDDTAAAVAVLQEAGRGPSHHILKKFERHDHFTSFPHELQFSFTVTARSVHAYRLQGADTRRWQRFLAQWQQADGRWTTDKWNISWLYTTGQVLLALCGSNEREAMQRAYWALLKYQHDDGGWGTGFTSNMIETAYGILGLYTLMKEGYSSAAAHIAIRNGHRWLLSQYLITPDTSEMCWLSKDLYRPYRVDQTYILSALLCVYQLEALSEMDGSTCIDTDAVVSS